MADAAEWYVVERGNSVGPLTLSELVARLPALGGGQAMVFGPELANWTPAARVPAIAAAMGSRPSFAPPPPPLPPLRPIADDITYEIIGQEIQYAEVRLRPGQMLIGEPGFLMHMTGGVRMETVLGDPSAQQQQGFLDKIVTASKRALTGESLFISTFTAASRNEETVAFAAPHPGKILTFDLAEHGGQIICQKDCFLCAARGVSISIAFQKRIMAGLFGGEGFIMQRLTGAGVALLSAGGTIMVRTLAPGETLRLQTGVVVAMEPTVTFDVQWVGGVRNALFGGEGLFFTTLTGPGKIWAQSLPFIRLAARVLAHFHPPVNSGEGNLLNQGLGTLFGRQD